jgi:nicotinamidase-related amidase
MEVPEIKERLEDLKQIKSVVIYGLEAHACLMKTCFDLIESGYEVHVLADGSSSQTMLDRKVAMWRMAQAGAFLTSSESVCLELVDGCKSPYFKVFLSNCSSNI